MWGREKHYGRIVVAGLLAGGVALSGWPAAAAPTPPPPDPLVEGPWPPSKVLAVDPSTVSPPQVITPFATTCPAAPYGVNRYAPGSGKRVALTFDDGPGASTGDIIRVLESEGVTASFFNIGVNATVRPSLVQAEAAQLFVVGNHTWSHPDMSRQSSAAQAAELDNATNEQISLIGARPCFFRPPYGTYNSTTLSLAQARNMTVFNWSVDTEDWKAEGSADASWVNRIISLGEAGVGQTNPVVLMHNQPTAMPATVAALRPLIDFYREQGYAFVDLDGRSLDRQVTGDWDGNGTTTPGVVRGNTWYLRNSNTSGIADVTFSFGRVTDRPVVGDWDGNGTVTPGVVRGNTWYLRNSNDPADTSTVTLTYGSVTDRVVTGDWDGDGTTTPGVVRGNTWYLRNSNTSGIADLALAYGRSTDLFVTGDWDGNGTTTPGVVRGNTWYLRDTNAATSGSVSLAYGTATDRVVTGDWDGNGTTTPGVTRGNTWYLRNSNTSGPGEITTSY